MYHNRNAMLFILMAFLAGLCGSFFHPLSSLFLVEALQATPAMLSAYMILSVCGSVIVSQWVAARSDAGWHRKRVLVISLASYFITVMGFTMLRDYYVVVGLALVFGSLSGAIFGQLFAIGREFADRQLEDSTTFLSTMRAGMAIAWVFGPPVAFILKAEYGFSLTFTLAGLTTLVLMALVMFAAPDQRCQAQLSDNTLEPMLQPVGETAPTDRATMLWLSIAIVLMSSANSLYITSMPLYLSQELAIGASLVGFLFGAAALCEIPIMINAGRLAKRFGTLSLLRLAMVFACLFYFGMAMVQNYWLMLLLQMFNGIFIGLTATLGMVAMQDMMKHRLGAASTWFTNLLQISALVASLWLGFIGEWFSYYSTLYVSLLSAFAALIVLNVGELRQSHAVMPSRAPISTI